MYSHHHKSEPKIQLLFFQEHGFQIIANSIPLEKKKKKIGMKANL